jgi:aryl-alcohol dehydrogenase-like predicted oxidoreductase
MEYRNLGNAGVRVSVIGIGTNRFGTDKVPQSEVNNIIDAAVEHGVNHIDTADTYAQGRSEETLGVALKGRWEKFVLASKFWFPMGDGPNDRGASRYHIMNALEASLRRLQSDHVDVYYVHRWDEFTPIEETLRTLDDLVAQGKIRYVGVSSFAGWQLAHAKLLADVRGWAPVTVIQSEYNLLERHIEREVLPYCRTHNVGFVPYFPLAGGFLTGKYKQGTPPPPGSRGATGQSLNRYMEEANYHKVERLQAWASENGRGLNELAQAWLLAQPMVCSVITGATRLEQFLGNVGAADWSLTEEDLGQVDALLT